MKWQTVPVAEIAKQVRGVSYDKSQVSSTPSQGLTPILRAGNIQDGSLLLNHDLVFVPESCVSSQQLLRPGDIVIAASSGSLDVVGKAAQVEQQWQGSFGAFCKVVRPTSDRIDPRYLHHFFQSSGYRRKVSSLAAGANINNLKNEHIDDIQIPLPPLEEQRRIAAILDKAGQLTEACASLHAARRQLGESLFVQAFGDPRLNPLGLPSMRLGEIVDCQLGKMLDKKRQNGGSQRPYLRNANIRWFEVDTSDVLFMDIKDREMERFGVRRGDLLVCEGGEPGRAAIWSGGDGVFGFQKALHRLRPDKSRVLPEYLNWVLWIWSQRGLLGDHITSATIAHLTREKLVKINILLPPLAVQECFVRELQMLDVLGHSGISRNKLIRSLNSSLFSTLMMRETG